MISIAILTATILSTVIGIIVLRKDFKSFSNRLFFAFSILIAFWTFWNYLLIVTKDPSYLKGTYALGALVIAGVSAWFYAICVKFSLQRTILIYLVGLAFFFLSLTNLVISDAIAIGDNGFKGVSGSLVYLYLIYGGVAILAITYLVIRSLLGLRGKERTKFLLIFLGLVGFGVSALLVSFILPLFGINGFEHLDSVSSLIYILFASYAKLKYD